MAVRSDVWCSWSWCLLVLGVWQVATAAHIPLKSPRNDLTWVKTEAEAASVSASASGKETNSPYAREPEVSSGGGEADENTPFELMRELQELMGKGKETPTSTITTTTIKEAITSTILQAPSQAPVNSNDIAAGGGFGGGGGGGGGAGAVGPPPQPPPGAEMQRPTTGSEAERGRGGGGDNSKYEFTKHQLNSLFMGGILGNASVVADCQVPHLTLKTRCFANVMEMTVASRMALLGRLFMEGGDGWAEVKGGHTVVYIVVGVAGRRGKLSTSLLKTDIEVACDYCHYLTALLYLKVGQEKCRLVGECAQNPLMRTPPSPTYTFTPAQDTHTPFTPSPAFHIPLATITPTTTIATTTTTTTTTVTTTTTTDPTITAKTTMRLLEDRGGSSSALNAPELAAEVSLGTRLILVVSAYSLALPLDLHLVKCEARDEEGRAVILLKNGCSVSQVLEDFREVIEAEGGGLGGDREEQQMRRVSQFARLRVFNTKAEPQNITLVCTVKVCSGECPERPPCVQSDINIGRSKRPVTSLYARQVILAKAFRVAGFPVSRPAIPQTLQPHQSSTRAGNNQSKDGSNTDNKECDCSHVLQKQMEAMTGPPRDCLSPRTLYLILALFLLLLIIAMFCVYYFMRRPSSYTYYDKSCNIGDTESPPRALYSEYSSPRRRTPQSTPEYSTLIMTKDAANSPMSPMY